MTYTLPASADPTVVLVDGQVVSVAGKAVLHDVGSFDPAGPLEIRGADPMVGTQAQGANGYNPPSLLGVARSAPYFHDGRYRTLLELVNAGHGIVVPLPPQGAAGLVEFLRSIDETTPPFALPP
jgi:hypothetical protein